MTVTGVNDPAVDGTQISNVTIAVDDAISDDSFDPLPDQTVANGGTMTAASTLSTCTYSISPEQTVTVTFVEMEESFRWTVVSRSGWTFTDFLEPHRFEGGGMRFLRFKRWLGEVNASVEALDAVYFEEVRRHAGVDAAQVYGGFMAHLTAWCEHHEIPYQGVPIGTIKKHATGRGNADKGAMIAAVRARGFLPADDNEADALALLLWVVEQE